MEIVLTTDNKGRTQVQTQGVPHPLALIEVMTQATAEVTQTVLRQMKAAEEAEEKEPEIVLPIPGNGRGFRGA